MYTIKEAAARSGVGASAIRAWERRYGVVRPVRTPAGYRLYDDDALRVLLAMRTLIETGWAASEAARAITAGEVDPGVLIQAGPALSSPDQRPAATPPDHRIALIARFLAAAEANSAPETEAVLDDMQGSGSYEAVIDDLLLPAAAALGDAWAAGRLSVAGEHAASAAVARRLAAVFQGAGAPGRATVVVGLPPGSRHELGALAFAAALRRRGVGVLYLGSDVTVDGWVDAVHRTGARAAVIGVVTAADRASADDVVRALLEQDLALVAIGGAAASTPGASAERVLILADGVVDAATRVAEAVGRRRR